MRRLINKSKIRLIICTLVFAMIAALIVAVPVSAAPSFQITNDLMVLTLSPGQSYSVPITITDVSSNEPMNPKIEVDGLGEALDGSATAIPASQDTSPFSARNFCSVNTKTVSIQPGGSQTVNATVSVPAGVQPSEYYAAIYIYNPPSSTDTTGIQTGSIVPVILTVPGFAASLSAAMTGINVPQTTAGQSIAVTSILQNTGNSRISAASDVVTLYNSSGTQVAQTTIALSSPSILPNYSRQFLAYFTAQSNGNYSVKSTITLGSGTALAAKTVSFNVTQTTTGSQIAAPTISSFTPTSGGSATQVTITGTGFTNATGVGFGGVAAANFSISSDTQIVATVGSGSSGAVTVTSPGGTATSSGNFTFVPVPVISSFSPISAGSNMTVTISGSNFTGATAVTFGGVNAASFNVQSATQITAVVGTGSTGVIKVTTPNGVATSTGTFTFAAAPTIGSFSPNTGGSGTSVIINGTNFTGATAVTFGGTNAANFTVQSATQINAIVDGGATGNIGITTPGGTVTSSGTFTFNNSAATSTKTTTTATKTASGATTPLNLTSLTPLTITTGNLNSITSANGNQNGNKTGIDSSSLLDFHINDGDSAQGDASTQDGVIVNLTGVSGSGDIIIAKYLGEPSDSAAFDDNVMNGGTGHSAMKFVYVQIKGYASGTGHVTLSYADSEASAFSPGSLILAYYFNNRWNLCTNMMESVVNNTISGDVPVYAMLNGAAIGVGGTANSTTVAGMPVNGQNNNSGSGISWSAVAIIIGAVAVTGIVVIVLVETKKKKSRQAGVDK
jgi:IPT/TIG domain